MSETIFFHQYFSDKWMFFLDLSQIEFCLRLDFVLDWIFLRLNFVSDYIPLLYFVCSHLIGILIIVNLS